MQRICTAVIKARAGHIDEQILFWKLYDAVPSNNLPFSKFQNINSDSTSVFAVLQVLQNLYKKRKCPKHKPLNFQITCLFKANLNLFLPVYIFQRFLKRSTYNRTILNLSPLVTRRMFIMRKGDLESISFIIYYSCFRLVKLRRSCKTSVRIIRNEKHFNSFRIPNVGKQVSDH